MRSLISRFRAAYLSDFSLAFLGFGIFRFWYQYNLYNLHATTDYGVGVAWTNVLRGVAYFLLVALVLRKEIDPRTRGILVGSSLALMTASAIFNMLEIVMGDPSFEIARYVTCGLGLVWGYCMWMDVYRRMEPLQAFLYLVSGLAISCLLSLFAGYLGKATMGLVNLFVPVLTVLAYWQAMRTLDEQGRPCCLKYPEGPRSSSWQRVDFVQLGSAFFIFAFVLGITLGFPDGEPRTLAQLPRTIHQMTIVAVLCWVLWWVLVQGRSFKFSAVWYFENALLIVAIVLLAEETALSRTLATALFLTAESFFYTFTFFTSHDIGRRVAWPSTTVLAVLYGGSLFCMGAGRLFSVVTESIPGGVVTMLLIMSALVVAEMVLALRPHHAEEEALFVDVSPMHPLVSRERVSCATDLQRESMVENNRASEADGVDEAIREHLAQLRENRDLTGNETRIAELIARGYTRAQVADALGYSENTIRNYTHALYVKLGVHTRHELISLLKNAR